MPRATKLKRRAFFVDEASLRYARKVLGVSSDAEVVRISVERIAEMERFWRFMDATRDALEPGSMERPPARMG
jgi:hypothetical protein